MDGDHSHTVANPSRGEKPGERGLNKEYRPGRKTQKRRQGKKIKQPKKKVEREQHTDEDRGAFHYAGSRRIDQVRGTEPLG